MSAGRVRRQRRRRRRSGSGWTRLRYLGYHRWTRRLVLFGPPVLLGLAIAWIAVTAFLVRRQLASIETRVAEVKALVAQGRVGEARGLAAALPAMGSRAAALTSGPAWWAAAHVPVAGDPLVVVRGATGAADHLTGRALPDLMRVAALVDPEALRVHGNTIRLAPLEQAGPQLGAAARQLRRIDADLAALPGVTWLGSVDRAHATLLAQVRAVSGYVEAAARVTRVLPTLLGEHGTRRYFIGLQNEAEMRGTGGLPGAFAIARATHGSITFEQFASDAALLPPTPDHAIDTGLDFGRDYDDLYAPAEPTRTLVNSDISPHFPYAAQIWARMWQRLYGQHIDGAIAVDPTTLAYFLAAVGPANLPGRGAVTANTVVPLTERDAYALFPDNTQRKDFLVSVLRAAARRLVSGAGTAYDIIQAATLSTKENRLQVWSADPAAERVLAGTGYGGAVPGGERPFAGLVLNNAAGGKLDYYLSRSMTYVRTGCGTRRDVLVTITLRNDAPAAGLPSYVTTRGDRLPPEAVPGDTHSIVDFYATEGAVLHSVTIDGARATVSVQRELGHPVFRFDLQLPRGTARTVELHLDEPVGTGSPLIWRQPGVTPLAVTSHVQSCP